MKAVLRGKFTALRAYLHKEFGDISHQQLNSTPASFRKKRSKLTQEEQKIIKLRDGINETETKRTIQIINETES